MKQSSTLKQYGISLSYRIIAYILLFSQVFTSCNTPVIMIPVAQDPPAEGAVGMTQLASQAHNIPLAGISETPLEEEDDAQEKEEAEKQEEDETEDYTIEESQQATQSWIDITRLLYAGVKGGGSPFLKRPLLKFRH